MTESEMNRIAEMVVDKIIARQKAYDEEFKAEIQSMVDDDAEIEFGTITEDEIIAEELIKLNNRLAQLLYRGTHWYIGVCAFSCRCFCTCIRSKVIFFNL